MDRLAYATGSGPSTPARCRPTASAWTAWLGFLLGLTVAGSLFTAWLAFMGMPIWSVVVGVVLLMSSDTADVAAPAA